MQFKAYNLEVIGREIGIEDWWFLCRLVFIGCIGKAIFGAQQSPVCEALSWLIWNPRTCGNNWQHCCLLYQWHSFGATQTMWDRATSWIPFAACKASIISNTAAVSDSLIWSNDSSMLTCQPWFLNANNTAVFWRRQAWGQCYSSKIAGAGPCGSGLQNWVWKEAKILSAAIRNVLKTNLKRFDN